MMLEMITEQVPLTGLQHGIIVTLTGILVILLIRLLGDKGQSPPEMMAEVNFKECPEVTVKLTSLEGAPLVLNGHFDTEGAQLLSLKGDPRTVKGRMPFTEVGGSDNDCSF